MVTLFLRQGETGKQVLLSFPTTTPAEKEHVDRTLETLKSMSKTVTIQGAASEVMNLGLYLSGVDLAAEGELERINQLADRLEHMSEVDCDKFAGMLDANSISGTKDILRLTGRLDDYVILPRCGSAQSIGKYLVGCGAFLVPEKLIGYINYDAVGIEFCDAHGGAACSRGFVVRKEGLPQELLDELHDQKQTQEMTLGGLKWNCQDKIRISFFVRSVTMHPLRKAENSKSFSVMPQVSERPMPCFRRLIRLRSVASMWLLDT